MEGATVLARACPGFGDPMRMELVRFDMALRALGLAMKAVPVHG